MTSITVRKIVDQRREGRWQLQLAIGLDGWWHLIASRDGGGHLHVSFRPQRESDARQAFLAPEEDWERAVDGDEDDVTFEKRTVH